MPDYVIDADARAGGTSAQGEVAASFTAIAKRFGPPTYTGTRKNGGDGKVSTQWIFRNVETDEVFTVYDYKETNLYDRGLPTVKAFRAMRSYDWHIGGRSKQGTERFIEWLQAALPKPRNAPKPKGPKPPGEKTTADHMAEVGKALDD